MKVSPPEIQVLFDDAKHVTEEENRILVSIEEYEWLCSFIDQPAAPAPRLRAALREKPVWNA